MNKSILRNYTFILLLLACAQCAALASTLEGTVLDPSRQAGAWSPNQHPAIAHCH